MITKMAIGFFTEPLTWYVSMATICMFTVLFGTAEMFKRMNK